MRKMPLFLKKALLCLIYSACIPNAVAHAAGLDASMTQALQKFTQTFKVQEVKVAVHLPNKQEHRGSDQKQEHRGSDQNI